MFTTEIGAFYLVSLPDRIHLQLNLGCILIVLRLLNRQLSPTRFIGSFFALAMMTLSALGILPGYDRQPALGQRQVYIVGPWGLCVGVMVTSLVLFFHRPRGLIFLDRICIHQTDSHLKTEGVINMCAFLKNSESMLVLWDATYVERQGGTFFHAKSLT